MGTLEHRQKKTGKLRVAVISVSTTRKLSEDKSGAWIKKQAKAEGHEVVVHHVVTDEITAIREMIDHVVTQIVPHAILVTGGTGVSPRDVTIEAVAPLFTKELTAFATLFAMLSFEEIDSAALLSRARAGIVNSVVVFCMPGSLKACKLACNQLIFPELGHLVTHVSETP
ncbi:MAG: molybdenum cofactor biosynthesis protein B [Desulfobacterium sp.]|jgi:molybdenum cofactor biosynthesis protein B|nr:molybdenum cofactor biosynthesis protein B [Desulfobacterium sp.]